MPKPPYSEQDLPLRTILTLVLAVLEDPTNETETVSDRVGFQITLFRRIATLASSTQTQLPHS
ncbi:MAG: hypothetical protein AAFP69_15315, partial [Planctomycetota bacterium]